MTKATAAASAPVRQARTARPDVVSARPQASVSGGEAPREHAARRGQRVAHEGGQHHHHRDAWLGQLDIVRRGAPARDDGRFAHDWGTGCPAGILAASFGVDAASGAAFGIGLQAVEVVLGAGLGAIFLIAEGLSLSDLRRSADPEPVTQIGAPEFALAQAA